MKLFNKFLVQRRDGSVPEWPWLVLGGADPAAPRAIRAYSEACRQMGMDQEYCRQLDALADRFELWRHENHVGDPDAGPHRTDDPDVIARMPEFATKLPPGIR